MAGALIVTAELAAPDFSWLNGLRQAHYPPERNQVPAHVTMFHSLPPSVEGELRSRLARIVCRKAPTATLAGLMDLGGGVAFRIFSPELDRIREEMASDLHGLLGAQDISGWKPHLTIQNKVAPKVARALKQSLEASFVSRSLGISGLAVQRYRGGPWELVASYSFRA
jgi:2'-5' RNA ligase superfamily protein